MDFQLSSEQAMLCDSVNRFVQDKYDFSSRHSLAQEPAGYSQDHWRTFSEMGWLALPVAEENGGLGGSVVDTVLLSRQFGKGLVLEPFLGSAVLGARLVEEIGTQQQKEQLLTGSIGGEALFAVAHAEPVTRHDLRKVKTNSCRRNGGFFLNGRKCVVTHAAVADQLLVVARTGGAAGDGEGLSVFLVSPDAAGLRRQDYRLADGQPASDLWFENVEAQLLGDAEGVAGPILDRVFDEVLCAACADAVGAMEAVLALTRDYLGTRRQFGRPLAENQVLQHRVADMFGALEEAAALTEMTAMRLAEGEVGASSSVAGTAARVFSLMRFVGEQGIQLHGGIGMTDDYPVGHYYKRLLTIEALHGSAAHHLQRFAATL